MAHANYSIFLTRGSSRIQLLHREFLSRPPNELRLWHKKEWPGWEVSLISISEELAVAEKGRTNEFAVWMETP